MNGFNSEDYQLFKELFLKGFKILRKYFREMEALIHVSLPSFFLFPSQLTQYFSSLSSIPLMLKKAHQSLIV